MCELLNLGGKKKLRLTPCYYSKHILRPTQELHSCQSDKPLGGQSVFLTKAFTLQYQRQTGAESLKLHVGLFSSEMGFRYIDIGLIQIKL